MTSHTNPCVRRRGLRLVAATVTLVVAALTTMLTVGATSALAADRCRTGGQAYLTQPGKVYSSGIDGDVRPEIVQTITVSRGAQFRMGGNGILPGTRIQFMAFKRNTSEMIDIFPGQRTYQTRPARDNCVVNEEGPFSVAASPGEYTIEANITLGNLLRNIQVSVVHINVV